MDEPSRTKSGSSTLGVVVVTYNSAQVIGDCLRSLQASVGVNLSIVICDNASTDTTLDVIRSLSDGFGGVSDDMAGKGGAESSAARLTLLRSERNLGFAGGVNAALRILLARPDIDLFWIINPDCIVEPAAAAAYVMAASGNDFALMGGRTLFQSDRQVIQSDGGTLSRWTAVCSNVNHGLRISDATEPDAGALDFISGANMVASRGFIERAGLMREDYFLFYEEVDWALRRGDLPLRLCPSAIVYHHGGTSTGSGTLGRGPSAFSNYFNYRNRLRLAWRHNRMAVPGAICFSLLKIAQLYLAGATVPAEGALRGLCQLPPPCGVKHRLRVEPVPPAVIPAGRLTAP